MPSAHSARSDLERLRGASGTAGDASPFRTAMRNIIAACRNSPLALASYCQQGVLPALATALQQPQVMSSTQLGTCVLEVALCLTQQLIDETKVTEGSGSSYAVGESVMARRLDGEFGEGARPRGQRGPYGRPARPQQLLAEAGRSLPQPEAWPGAERGLRRGHQAQTSRSEPPATTGTVVDALGDGSYLVVWNEEEAQAAKLDAAELMPFGSGMGLSTERRQRVAPAFILNNFLTKTAIPSNAAGVKVPHEAAAQLGSCASLRRTLRLWAARHPQGRGPAAEDAAMASDARASRLQSRRSRCV